MRHARGSVFLDYVRMIRHRRDVDFSRWLEPADLAYLDACIDQGAWYPMDTFERFGVAILREIAQGQLGAVRLWGRSQAPALIELHPDLLAPGDPRESLMRFQTLRRGFFDFQALEVRALEDDHALVDVGYHMSAEAEEAACVQTLGFLEQLVIVAGGRSVRADFTARGWRGDPTTTIELFWTL